ncbi:NAD(P)H-binding protein, partial [Amycolatopsis solani]
MARTRRCAVLGATGFVGRALTADLVAAGYPVHVLARSPPHDLPAAVTVTRGDAADPGSLAEVFAGADVVFHLVHSLREPGFAGRDRVIAERVASAAAEAGVRQLVYLGGPRPAGETSAHLASRSEVAEVLLDGPVPAVAFQASMILGRGSAGLELLARTARLPVRPRPGWTTRRSRPVALADVRHYLAAAVESAPLRGRYDVSGPEEISYHDLVRRCARVLGRPAALAVPAPLWSHRAAALVAGLTSPVPAAVAAPLFGSLDHDLLPADAPAETVLPPPPGGPVSLDNALRAALGVPVSAAPAGRAYVDDQVRASDAGPD